MRGMIGRHYRPLIRTVAVLYFLLFCAGLLQSFIGAEDMRDGFNLPPWMSRILTVIGTDGMPVLMIFDRDAVKKEGQERRREIEAPPPNGGCGAGVREEQL
jgi:hypothetical protein